MADDQVDITVKLRDVTRFDRDAKRAARAIDNIGDQARQAARQLRKMNTDVGGARISLGPFSTSMRTGAIAIGALSLGLNSATPALLGFAEATASVVGGAGAAGGVGLVALAQGFGVASLATKDLTDALGGNAAALKRLSPEMTGLFDTLSKAQTRLRGSAIAGLLPGLSRGARSAMRNFGTVNRITRRTGSALGGLAQQAGGMVGSRAFGADIRTVGTGNIRIITSLGHATLSLANATRSLLVTAQPLATWLAELTARGAAMLDIWIQQERVSGGLSRFFKSAKTDLQILGRSTGNLAGGIINLFGARDVDGTRTLRSFERLTQIFQRWSEGVRGQDLGQAIADQIPKAGGLIAAALANTIARAVPEAARIFWNTFWNSDAAGKALIGSVLLKKTGAFGLLAGALGNLVGGGKGGKGGVAGKVLSKGSSPANPLFVAVVNSAGGLGGTPIPKRPTRAAGRALARGAKAIPVIGTAIVVGEGINEFGKQAGIDPPTAARRAPRGRGQVFHIEIPVHINGREIARANRDFNTSEAARNALRIDREMGKRAPGGGH